MLTYLKGDIFNSPAQVLVNTVNTVGVMGKGVALEYKNKYPDMFKYYQDICDKKLLDIGKLSLWKENDKWILLFPTKKHWRNPSKMEYIEMGLKKFVESYYRLGIESVAFPRLGCGNGQLRWEDVRPLMEHYLAGLPIQIYIYVDVYKEEVPEHKQLDIMEKWIHSFITAIGFEMLKEDIQKRIAENPILELQDGKCLSVEWFDNIITIRNGLEKKIDEQVFCAFWNYIRETGIFKISQVPEQFKENVGDFFAILKKLDYIQPIIISEDGLNFDNVGNGFQYTGK